MSRFDYEQSKRLVHEDYPFAALIMAALRKADTVNEDLLRRAFPAIHQELHERYHAPSGTLESDRQE